MVAFLREWVRAGCVLAGCDKSGPCARKPLAHGVGRAVCHGRDLLGAETVEIAQQQERSILDSDVPFEEISDGDDLIAFS
jgi:hypothetical protein